MMRPAVAMMLALAVCSSACEQGGDSSTGDPSTCSDDGDWYLHCPDAIDMAPGEWLSLDVDRVDDPGDGLFLWIEDLEAPIRMEQMAPAPGTEGSYVGGIPLPPLPDGTYSFALGTGDTPRSNWVSVDITAPEPRLSQAEVAQIMTKGYNGLVDAADGLIFSDEPAWAEARQSIYTDEQLATLSEAIDEARRAAAVAGPMYMELDPEAERTYQSYLDHSGFLPFLESVADTPGWPSPEIVAASFKDTFSRPVQRALVMGDSVGFGLAVFGKAMDVGMVVALMFPGIGEVIDALGLEAKIVLDLVKWVIDSWLPTDLVAIHTQGQSTMFDGEASSYQYWGTFRPQNSANGSLRSMSSLATDLVSELLPVKAPKTLKNKLIKLGSALATKWLTSAGFKAGTLLVDGSNAYLPGEIVVPIDLDPYRVPVISQLQDVPGFFQAKVIQFIVESFDVASPVGLQSVTPSWASATASLDTSDPGRFSATATGYPTTRPDEAWIMELEMSGYRLGSREAFIFTFPWPEKVQSSFGPVTVLQDVDPRDANQLRTDEAYILPRLPGGSADDLGPILTRKTTADRTYILMLRDDGGFNGPDPAAVDVYVNGTKRAGNLTAQRFVFTYYQIPLDPGHNEVKLVNLNTDYSPCYNNTTSGQGGCMVVGFPEAMNLDKTSTAVFADTDTDSRTYEVWTPPLVN